MDLSAKLQLKGDHQVATLLVPASVELSLSGLARVADGERATALIVFVADRAVLDEQRQRIVESAAADHLTWVAYPKSGQLGTDLNRDSLAASLTESGIGPVRQIAIDDVWSALRFRPA